MADKNKLHDLITHIINDDTDSASTVFTSFVTELTKEILGEGRSCPECNCSPCECDEDPDAKKADKDAKQAAFEKKNKKDISNADKATKKAEVATDD